MAGILGYLVHVVVLALLVLESQGQTGVQQGWLQQMLTRRHDDAQSHVLEPQTSGSRGTHIPLSSILQRFRTQSQWPPIHAQTTAAPRMSPLIGTRGLEARWQELRSQMRSQTQLSGRSGAGTREERRRRLEALKAQQELEARTATKQHIAPPHDLHAPGAKRTVNEHVGLHAIETQVQPKQQAHHEQSIKETILDVPVGHSFIDDQRLKRLQAKERRLTAKIERISQMRSTRARMRKLTRLENRLHSVQREIADITNTNTHPTIDAPLKDVKHGDVQINDHAGAAGTTVGGMDAHNDHLGAPAILTDIDLSKGIPGHITAAANRPLPGHTQEHGTGSNIHKSPNHANVHPASTNPQNIGFVINDMPIIDLTSPLDPADQLRHQNAWTGSRSQSGHRARSGHAHSGHVSTNHRRSNSNRPHLANTWKTWLDSRTSSGPRSSGHSNVNLGTAALSEGFQTPGGAFDTQVRNAESTSGGGIRLTNGELMPMPMRQP